MEAQLPDFQPTVASHRAHARTLTREEYTDPDVFKQEQERIFSGSWYCIGRQEQWKEPGEYRVVEVAGESLVVVRDEGDRLHALFNSCRHRGARLCNGSSEGSPGLDKIRCGYHGWTYGLDGGLLAAPHMEGVEGFGQDENALHKAMVALWEGFVFVNLAADPTPFEKAWRPLMGRFGRFGLPALKQVHEEVYDITANWKLVFENYNECLHCPLVHPELNRVLPYDSGANDLTKGPFLGGYMEIRPPHESGTISGRRCGPDISSQMPREDRRRAYFYSMMPNLCLSIHPDYVVYFLVEPVAVDRTRLTAGWLFHPDAVDGGARGAQTLYRPQEAVRFWDVTNRQDWRMVESSQRGVSSRRFTPGFYSTRESVPAAWDEEYRRWMEASAARDHGGS